MKPCQQCGCVNTDVTNVCVECGAILSRHAPTDEGFRESRADPKMLEIARALDAKSGTSLADTQPTTHSPKPKTPPSHLPVPTPQITKAAEPNAAQVHNSPSLAESEQTIAPSRWKKQTFLIALPIVSICLLILYILSPKGPSNRELNKFLVGEPLLGGYFAPGEGKTALAVKIDSISEISRDKSIKATGNALFPVGTVVFPIRFKAHFSRTVTGNAIPKDAPEQVTVRYYFFRNSEGGWGYSVF